MKNDALDLSRFLDAQARYIQSFLANWEPAASEVMDVVHLSPTGWTRVQ